VIVFLQKGSKDHFIMSGGNIIKNAGIALAGRFS